MQVGVRELKQQTSELVRLVREDGQVVLITYHGKVVAKLIPVESQPLAEETEDAWATLERLAKEIGKAWKAGMTAVEAVSESRR